MIGTVNIKTRPLKLAFLIDPKNSVQIREAINISSTLWGGSYFPIIQLHKRMPHTWRDKPLKSPSAKSVILGYIDTYDPDILVQLSKAVPQYIIDSGIEVIKKNEIWGDFIDKRVLSPKYGIGLLELMDDIYKHHFKFNAKFPLKVIFPKLPQKYTLYWASFFGEIPNKFTPILSKYYSVPLEIETSSFNIEKLSAITARNVLFPRRITQHGIIRYNRSSFRRDACVFFMDATNLEDIVDFWNLRALGKYVVPVPKQFKDDLAVNEIVTDFLKAHRKHWRHDPKVCDFASIIRSRSSTMKEIEEYAKTLRIEPIPKDSSNDPYYALQHWYPRIWDEWARDKDAAIPDDIYGEKEKSIDIPDTKENIIRIPSLIPNFSDKHSHYGEPRCANDISFRFYGTNEFIAEVFPKHTGDSFIHAISGIPSLKKNWRVGRNGLVKLVAHDFRDSQYIPKAEKLFFAWLQDMGWIPKLSPPGLLAKQIYKKLEGHLFPLRNERLLGLLEHMNGGTVQQDGSPVEKNIINQERDILVGEVKKRLDQDSPMKSNLHDYLIEKGVFRLGIRIQCPKCFRDSWYTLESIKDQFSCPKCLDDFNAVGNIDISKWTYKTSGSFSTANYAEGAFTVLLTIDFLGDSQMRNIQITPTTSFTAKSKDNNILEVDFAAFWQDSVYGEKNEGLLFGECKTYGVFKSNDFERMQFIADTFPGAVLVFSTLKKQLTSHEIKGISRIAKKGRKFWKPERPINPVLILTGNELSHPYGIPSCWEESTQNKFKHIQGLINTCDATQQIYLNLPSWHIDWRIKWDRKCNNKN